MPNPRGNEVNYRQEFPAHLIRDYVRQLNAIVGVFDAGVGYKYETARQILNAIKVAHELLLNLEPIANRWGLLSPEYVLYRELLERP
jgi:hypothetical protein